MRRIPLAALLIASLAACETEQPEPEPIVAPETEVPVVPPAETVAPIDSPAAVDTAAVTPDNFVPAPQ